MGDLPGDTAKVSEAKLEFGNAIQIPELGLQV
jgi:hypothetical protein